MNTRHFVYDTYKYNIDFIEIYIPYGIKKAKTLEAIKKLVKGKAYSISFKSGSYSNERDEYGYKNLYFPIIIRLPENLVYDLEVILMQECITYEKTGIWSFKPFNTLGNQNKEQ